MNGQPKFVVIAATIAVRLGRDDEILRIGCYGLFSSRDKAEQLRSTLLRALPEWAKPCIIDYANLRVFPVEDQWREAQGVAVP